MFSLSCLLEDVLGVKEGVAEGRRRGENGGHARGGWDFASVPPESPACPPIGAGMGSPLPILRVEEQTEKVNREDFLPPYDHGRGSLSGLERVELSALCWVLSRRLGEGSGSPLQCSCLENPVDRGAWWAAVHEVTESDRTEAT